MRQDQQQGPTAGLASPNLACRPPLPHPIPTMTVPLGHALLSLALQSAGINPPQKSLAFRDRLKGALLQGSQKVRLLHLTPSDQVQMSDFSGTPWPAQLPRH